jgi:hypothetical protein
LLAKRGPGMIAVRDNLELLPMYRGIERRMSPRHRSLKAGVIALERDSLECRIWDFSPAGAGLFVTTADRLPAEFDVIFDYATRHCFIVWQQLGRVGLKYKSERPGRRLLEPPPRSARQAAGFVSRRKGLPCRIFESPPRSTR